jgi:hypothetical protein
MIAVPDGDVPAFTTTSTLSAGRRGGTLAAANAMTHRSDWEVF